MDLTLHVWTVWNPGQSKSTVEQHKRILKRHGQVWWGIIHPKEYHHHRNYFDIAWKELQRQVQENHQNLLFVRSLGHEGDNLYGKISKISIDDHELQSKRDKIVPIYYYNINKKLFHIKYWFLLEELDKLPEEQLKKVRPFRLQKFGKDDFNLRKAIRINLEYDSIKFGAEGYPYPCFCNFDCIPEIIGITNKTKLKKLPKNFQHNDDYTVITLKNDRDKVLKFTPKQAPMLQTLVLAWRSGTPFVSRESLLKSVGASEGRIRDKIRSRKNEWDQIVMDEDGLLFRINLPGD